MIEIEKPKIEAVEMSEDNRYGKFVVEPLERGTAPRWVTPPPHFAVLPSGCGSHLHPDRRSLA